MNRPTLKLPAKAAPKQLTAHRRVPTLSEHKEAFLNANNPKGFLPDEEPEKSDTLGALLREMMELPFITNSQITQYKYKIREVAGEVKINSRMFYTITARLFGHSRWEKAYEYLETKGHIPNLNYNSKGINLQLFGVVMSEYTAYRQGIERVIQKSRKPVTHHTVQRYISPVCRTLEIREKIDVLLARLAKEVAREEEDVSADNTRYFVRTNLADPTQASIIAQEFVRREFRHPDGYNYLKPPRDPKGYAYVKLSIDLRSKVIVNVDEEIHHVTDVAEIKRMFGKIK